MDSCQRSVIQNNYMDIVQDLFVTEDFLGKCYQERLFDSTLIDMIRSEKTMHQRAHKVLDMLPRRGPEAFDIFVGILRVTSPWLAEKLEKNLIEERERNEKSKLDSPVHPDRPCQLELNQDIVSYQSTVQQQLEINGMHIKEKLEYFIQKTFGLHRKLSQADKRAVEKFLHDEIQYEKQKHQRQLEVVTENSENSKSLPNSVKSWLCEMHLKLKIQGEICDSEDSMRSDSDHESSPKYVTLQTLENQIGTVLKKIRNLEKQISFVYDLFPQKFRRKSLMKLVQEILMQNEDMKKNLRQLQEENDNLYRENFTITMDKKKLEHEKQLKDVQLEVKTSQLHKLQLENKNIMSEVEKLQRINTHHAEKEKTLCELQIMVNELRESKEMLVKENTNLKFKIDGEQKAVSRTNQSPRRLSSYAKGSNTKGCKLKGGNKKKPNPYQKG